MPFFARVFRGKESSAAKKAAKFPTIDHDPTPAKPTWTDAWQRTEVAPTEVQELLRGCTHELKARGMDSCVWRCLRMLQLLVIALQSGLLHSS